MSTTVDQLVDGKSLRRSNRRKVFWKTLEISNKSQKTIENSENFLSEFVRLDAAATKKPARSRLF
jgi:hypothetical protein